MSSRRKTNPESMTIDDEILFVLAAAEFTGHLNIADLRRPLTKWPEDADA